MFSFSSLNRHRGRPLGSWLRAAPTGRTVNETFTLAEVPERQRPNEVITSGETVFRCCGLDLGQLKDPSAAAMVRVRKYSPNFHGPRYLFADVCYLRQWAPGTDYHDVVDDVLALHPDMIMPDFGGPGPPVYEIMLRRAAAIGYRGKLLPIQLVSSNAQARVHTDPRRRKQWMTVPKRDIVSTLNIFQQRRVIVGVCERCGGTGEHEVKDGRKKLSKGCPHCRTLRYPDSPEVRQLLGEFKTFKMRYTKSANQTFDHRGPDHHGDLSIALALALWAITRGTRELACNT